MTDYKKVVATPQKDYRFLITPDTCFGTPWVQLQRRYERRWLGDRWNKVKSSGTWELLDSNVNMSVEEYVEAIMKHLWNEHVEEEKNNSALSAYWKDENAHDGFDVTVAISA